MGLRLENLLRKLGFNRFDRDGFVDAAILDKEENQIEALLLAVEQIADKIS